MEDTKTLLNTEIQEEFESLKDLELGSKEYETTVNGLTKLVDKQIELEKLKIETAKHAEDNEFREKQHKNEKKDQLVKNVLTGVGIGLPILVTIWGTIVSLKFEETGSVTTMMGRGFINKLLLKK